MVKQVKYCLSNLTNFTGRDSRQVFWFYVLALVVLQYAAGLAVSIPMMVEVFSGAINAAQAGVRDQTELQATMMSNMTGYMSTQMWFSAGIGLISSFLISAAFVRRLHDAGFPGWIAAIAIATYLISLAYTLATFDEMMVVMVEAMDPANGMNPLTAQAEMAPWSLLGWVGYLFVIGFGVLKSQDGPYKYGDTPVSF